MNLLRLDLLKFGPFSGTSIEFGGDGTGLHVVYGENEAGKSSSLRALRQLLYGIPNSSADNFLHANSDLRIGATLRAQDGRTLVVVRRKGNKNTLRGADDESIVDGRLLDELLGRRDAEAFQKRHGIDYDELIAGGRAVAEGKGDLATTLFAAGSGVVELHKIQVDLNKEVDDLFAPRASTKPINKALAEFKQSKDDAASKRLRTADWAQLQAKLRETREAEQREAAALGELREELETNGRLRRGCEFVTRRRELREALRELQEVPRLPADAATKSQGAILRLKHAEANLQRVVELLRDTEAQLAALPATGPLVKLADRVVECHQQYGSYQKAARDCVGLEAERKQLFDEVSRTLGEVVGRTATAADVEAYRTMKLPRAQVQKLAKNLGDLKSRLAQIDKQQSDAAARRASLERRVAAQGEVPQTGELERTLKRVRKDAAIEAEARKRRTDATAARRRASTALERLPGWTGTLDELATTAFPSLETIELRRAQFDELRDAATRLDEERRRLATDRDLNAVDLARLDAQGVVPTIDDLAAARARRDAGWRLVRAAWEAHPAPADEIEAFRSAARDMGRHGETPGLADAYELVVERADELVDQIRSEADRVALKATLTLARAQLDVKLQAVDEQRTGAQQKLDAARGEWRELWSRVRVDAGEPAEMAGWLGRVAQILSEVETAQAADHDADELTRRANELRDSVLAAWRVCQPGAGAADASLTQTLDEAEGAVEVWRRADQEATAGRVQLAQLIEEEDRRREERETLARQQQALVEPWRVEMARLSLAADATADDAEDRLSTLQQIQTMLRKLQDQDERITAIHRDGEDFARSLAELLERAQYADAGWSVDAAPKELLDRLNVEQKGQARRKELEEEQAKWTEERRRLEAECVEARTTLQLLCEAAGVATSEELPAVEEASARRRAMEEELQQAEKHLRPLAAPATVDKFADDVLAQDPAELVARGAELETQIRTREARRLELNGEVARLEEQERKLDQSAGAVEAEFAMQNVLARLQTDAREYSRRKLAAVVLRRAIERYRERSQGPLLRRAGELFGRLTLDSFVDLRADWDEAGRPVLVGVRSDRRRTVGIDGMSTGTRDQLYLALRLASLEQDVERTEPLPFIVDDILIQFDDERSAAALRILAELGTKCQVIFFTHHAHLVDLARATLAAGEFHVHELKRATVAS